MNTGDYFTTQDMQFFGPEVWERVRAKLRAEGRTVVKGYGEYGRNSVEHHFIYLSEGGNLIHTKDKPIKGNQISIQKYMNLGSSSFKQLKIKTGNDKDVVRQAFQHLVDLGFGDVNRGAVLNDNKGPLYGIVGDTDGIIYSILTPGGFEDNYHNAEELVFDVEVKTTVSNFRPKRKQIEVFGFDVYEDEFIAALEKLAIKSAA